MAKNLFLGINYYVHKKGIDSMKKQFIACGVLVALITAGSLSVSAEVIYKSLSSGNDVTNLPTYTIANPAGQMQPPPCDGMRTNCAPPPANSNEFNTFGRNQHQAPPPSKSREFDSYSYNSNDRPAPPSFSGDRPDMPPNMSQQYRPYQTRYNK
jgi:hypothetical protein